ncbi:hypothetical protein L211DRAFT_841482 [Terfezia boudieri ATCC MYA-4762]|uniref:Uncharacterized protein n=1 Tax=Terfezia boudieri ATCC MYA-4762 TaxID=1051890 RepID=A0A3N4LCY7_9PEZI|nr:hypothetical protein L211DRAFT_841482 [Terfezia boudieri ATCC MYA-4762]
MVQEGYPERGGGIVLWSEKKSARGSSPRLFFLQLTPSWSTKRITLHKTHIPAYISAISFLSGVMKAWFLDF